MYKQVQSKHTFKSLFDFDDVHHNFVGLTSACRISQGKDPPMALSVGKVNWRKWNRMKMAAFWGYLSAIVPLMAFPFIKL